LAVRLRVGDVMDTNVVSVRSGTTVADAVKTMVKENVWSLVVEVKGLPEGVVTERDILRRCLAKGLLPDKVLVESIMSSPLITISPDANIREAMSIMVEKEIRRLFIVEKGKIRGRVTQTRLFESSLQVMLNLSNLSVQL
jgi:CBS domain-containing protein